MRKIVVTLLLGFVFTAYALHQRDEAGAIKLTPASGNPGSGSTTNGSTTSSEAQNTPTPSPAATSRKYKDGTYTGSTEDAYYGFIQVQATVSGGQLTDVQFLQYPNDRDTSRMINGQAMPMLRQEALSSQSAQVDGVSGATDTSRAFVASLGNALSQAQ